MVRARVKAISLVPENELYSLELEFPDGLRTNYNRNLEFSQSLQGTAEIITDDIQLLIRILNPLKALFKKHLNISRANIFDPTSMPVLLESAIIDALITLSPF